MRIVLRVSNLKEAKLFLRVAIRNLIVHPKLVSAKNEQSTASSRLVVVLDVWDLRSVSCTKKPVNSQNMFSE